MSDLKIQVAAGTNVGLVRQNHEDNFVVCPDLTASDWRIPQVCKYEDLGECGALLVVADGMGGANAGEVASAIAIETIRDAFSQAQLSEIVKNDKAVHEFMKEVVKAADLRIFKKSKSDSSTQGMGTTVVMAWVLGNNVYVCWCGDSRCYMLNKHKGLVRLSKDHSYVQELIDRGELDPDLAMNHPYSNVITRCLGDMENRAVPDTRVFQVHNGDTILLCSDGLSGLCTDYQILDLLIQYRDDIEKCKEELITAALNEGGHDNVTVALCNIEIPDEKEDLADNALPKGTLPPMPEKGDLSKTLNSEKPQQNVPKKGRFWKILLFFIFMAVIAFLTVRWLRTQPSGNPNSPEVTTEDSVNNEKIDSLNEGNQEKGIEEIPTPPVEETKPEKKESIPENKEPFETNSTQVTEEKQEVKKDTNSSETPSVDLIQPDSDTEEGEQPDSNSVKQN